ncbi:hypothetical protein [Citricoccus muralis]|uniref:Uncharacterized protein n=1 Tax=Citricoccus muralis TaxID=169134 RepID=A0A3D9LAT0_9MICC|nr:hypothetical protein [Citricoccus muralis]REE03222.1 hypothetical protein C8E99_1027 [Citricoccus muralis]
MPDLKETDLHAIAEALADPALDSWVAMQDVGAEAESYLDIGGCTWRTLDQWAVDTLCWMESLGLIRVGQYKDPKGLVFWAERGQSLKDRLLHELTGADLEGNRMNTMLCLTRPGVEWAKKVTGRSDSQLLHPAPVVPHPQSF